MSSTQPDQESWRQLVSNTVLSPAFRHATFAGVVRRDAACPWVRIAIRPIELRGERYLQFSYFDAKKDITKNLLGPEIGPRLDEILDAGFAGIHLSTRDEEIDIRTTRRGKVLIGRRKVVAAAPEPLPPHNRVKDVPLPEGRADRLLETLGILT